MSMDIPLSDQTFVVLVLVFGGYVYTVIMLAIARYFTHWIHELIDDLAEIERRKRNNK